VKILPSTQQLSITPFSPDFSTFTHLQQIRPMFTTRHCKSSGATSYTYNQGSINQSINMPLFPTCQTHISYYENEEW